MNVPRTPPCDHGFIKNLDTCACECPKSLYCPLTKRLNDKTCKCDCNVVKSCPYNQRFDTDKCQCVCPLSTYCPLGHILNPKTCNCECPPHNDCKNRQVFDEDNCQCVCLKDTYCPPYKVLDTDTCECLLSQAQGLSSGAKSSTMKLVSANVGRATSARDTRDLTIRRVSVNASTGSSVTRVLSLTKTSASVSVQTIHIALKEEDSICVHANVTVQPNIPAQKTSSSMTAPVIASASGWEECDPPSYFNYDTCSCECPHSFHMSRAS